MTTPNQVHQSGHARAYIEWHPSQRDHTVWLFSDDHVVTMSEDGLMLNPVPPGAAAEDDQFFMKFAPEMEDKIIDFVKALAKAFDLYTEQPGTAYAQGYAEGEATVLREWLGRQRSDTLDLKREVAEFGATAGAGDRLVLT